MKLRVIFTATALLFFVNIAIWFLVFSHEPQKLKVVFLDVGQGDSIYIQAPNGRQMLIDGGRDRKVLESLGKVMPFGDKSIDVVLATHPDADHIGGFPYIFDSYQILNYIDNGVSVDTMADKTLKEKLVAEKSSYTKASRGMKIILDKEDNVYVDVLSPYFPTENEKDTNNGSIVAKLTYGSSTFMFAADAPIYVEDYLAKTDGDSLKSVVLKAGHHGSRTSLSESFIKTVSPEYAIISSGKGNRYGHPHQEVLDFFQKIGATILRTDELGNIECEGDFISVLCK